MVKIQYSSSHYGSNRNKVKHTNLSPLSEKKNSVKKIEDHGEQVI